MLRLLELVLVLKLELMLHFHLSHDQEVQLEMGWMNWLQVCTEEPHNTVDLEDQRLSYSQQASLCI